jgi:iron complex transport system substrate-binding protein
LRAQQHSDQAIQRDWLSVSFFFFLALVCGPIAVPPATADSKAHPIYERVVSLSPLITENIFLLGAGTAWSATPSTVSDRKAQHIEKVGSVQELSLEKIVSLNPQLILASNLTPPQTVEQLRSLALRVETFGQPASFEDICNHFLRLGAILNRNEYAVALVDQARRKVDAVRRAVSSLPRRKVFLQVGAHPLFSSVQSSFTHDFIELGAASISPASRKGAMKTEQVLALNPDLIIIAVMGSENGIGAEEKARWMRFSTLEAVRANQVHVMDPNLVCSPSPTTFADTLVTIAP